MFEKQIMSCLLSLDLKRNRKSIKRGKRLVHVRSQHAYIMLNKGGNAWG